MLTKQQILTVNTITAMIFILFLAPSVTCIATDISFSNSWQLGSRKNLRSQEWWLHSLSRRCQRERAIQTSPASQLLWPSKRVCFIAKKKKILNINIQGKNIPRKYVILLNGLDQFNLPKEKVSAFQKQEACVSRIAKPWLNICRSDNVTKSTLHNTNDLFASVMWMH